MADLRKINLMYTYFGRDYNHFCTDCKNLRSVNLGSKTKYKCTVYGNTSSEASDWKKNQTACGQYNKVWNMKPLMKCVNQEKPRDTVEVEPLEGQTSLFE